MSDLDVPSFSCASTCNERVVPLLAVAVPALNFIRGVLPWLPFTNKRYYLYDMDLGPRDNREDRVKKASPPSPRLDDATRGTKGTEEGGASRHSELRGPKVLEETPRTDCDPDKEKLSLEVSPCRAPNRFGAGCVVGRMKR